MRRGYQLVPGWCWGYACRKISGSSTWSNHAWGLAVDLNAPKNPYGSRLVTDMPSWMPALWKSYGFRWGGDYRNNKDAMHYEFMGSVADAKRQTERARAELGKGGPVTPEPGLNTSRITKIELRQEYEEASARWPILHDIERQFGLPGYLLFAVGSRETNLQEKYTQGSTGDGGHGHGVFQLDDRWHDIPPGFDTDINAQARKAAEMLADGIARHGLLGGLNYYNSGDTATSETTGKDYGPDVIARMEFLQAVFSATGKEGDDVIRIIKTTNYDGSSHDGVFVEANFSTVKWVPNNLIWDFAAKYAVAGGGSDGPVLVRRDEFDTLHRIGNAPAKVWPT